MYKIVLSKVKDTFDSFGDIFKTFKPQTKDERIIAILLFLFFSSFSLVLALKTSISDNLNYPVDLYFSFDNVMYYTHGYSDLSRHPLIPVFTTPILFIGNILFNIFHEYKVRTVFIVLVCNVLVSLSVVYIFRYLREIISLSRSISFFIIAFYASCGMILLLSFTLESFTLSLFLLSFTIWYYSRAVNNKESTSFLADMVLCISLGGITIPSISKGLIPILFQKEKFFIKVKKCAIISVVFILILLFFQWKYQLLTNVQDAYTEYSNPTKQDNFFISIISDFFGIPILLSDFILAPHADRLKITTISYQYFWQYIFIIILLIGLILSILKNYKNQLVLMICAIFSIDIIIHFILQYGRSELYLYAGHWIFIVPILLGWLYKSLNDIQKKVFLFVFAVLFLILLINNAYWLSNFIGLSINAFPPLKINTL